MEIEKIKSAQKWYSYPKNRSSPRCPAAAIPPRKGAVQFPAAQVRIFPAPSPFSRQGARGKFHFSFFFVGKEIRQLSRGRRGKTTAPHKPGANCLRAPPGRRKNILFFFLFCGKRNPAVKPRARGKATAPHRPGEKKKYLIFFLFCGKRNPAVSPLARGKPPLRTGAARSGSASYAAPPEGKSGSFSNSAGRIFPALSDFSAKRLRAPPGRKKISYFLSFLWEKSGSKPPDAGKATAPHRPGAKKKYLIFFLFCGKRNPGANPLARGKNHRSAQARREAAPRPARHSSREKAGAFPTARGKFFPLYQTSARSGSGRRPREKKYLIFFLFCGKKIRQLSRGRREKPPLRTSPARIASGRRPGAKWFRALPGAKKGAETRAFCYNDSLVL